MEEKFGFSVPFYIQPNLNSPKLKRKHTHVHAHTQTHIHTRERERARQRETCSPLLKPCILSRVGLSSVLAKFLPL